ncbi:hypothetical protein LINPERPRIM_LOCUS24892 [Linum perenne]
MNHALRSITPCFFPYSSPSFPPLGAKVLHDKSCNTRPKSPRFNSWLDQEPGLNAAPEFSLKTSLSSSWFHKFRRCIVWTSNEQDMTKRLICNSTIHLVTKLTFSPNSSSSPLTLQLSRSVQELNQLTQTAQVFISHS